MINQVLQELLSTHFKIKMQEMWTAIPAVVLTVHDGGRDQRIDVQPILTRRWDNWEEDEYPPILSIPVQYPSSSTSAMTFPVNVGDAVLCVFSKIGIDTFKAAEDNAITTPLDYRSFDVRDAIAIPGLFTFYQAINNPARYTLSHNTNDLNITHNIGKSNEVRVKLGADGGAVLENGKGIISISADGELSLMRDESNYIKVSDSGVEIKGVLTINGQPFLLHNHSGVTAGTDPSGPVIPIP